MSDYIDRQVAIDAIMALMPSLKTADGSGQFDAEIYRVQELFVDIGQALNDLPPAEVEPVKTGRWIVHTDKFANGAEYFGYAVCSECGDMFNCMETIGLKPIWDYCPNCGARMEGKNETDRC